jgi:hypothetical protein
MRLLSRLEYERSFSASWGTYFVRIPYAAGGVGGTLVKGASAVTMKNDKGVVIDMWTTKKGLDLSLGGGGLKIELIKE